MKTNMLKLLCAVICLLTVLACHTALAEDGWEYRATEDGFAQITSYTDEGDRIVSVPDKIDGKWVVSIGEDAFKNADSMKIVAIPGTVTHIHENAFSGRTDFCIRAYNGSAALKFAKIMGVESQNLSELYFTDWVVDLTGINASEYSYISNGVRLLNAHARRLEVGSLFFIPADERNSLGEAYEVRSMEEDGKYVNIKMAKADPTLVLTKVKFELTDLVPDYENAEILSDCVTDIQVYNDNNYVYDNIGSLNAGAHIRIVIDSWTIEAAVDVEVSELSVDVDLMPFQVNSYNEISQTKFEIIAQYETASYKSKTEFKKDILKIPLVSAYKAVTVYAVLSMEIDLSGTISMKISMVNNSQSMYSPETGLIKNSQWSKPNTEITLATELKGRVAVPKITIECAVLGEFFELGYYLEASLEGKTVADILNTETMTCSDVTLTLSHYLELWIGIKFNGEEVVGWTMQAGQQRLSQEFFHWENFKPVEQCTKKGATLHFDTDYEYVELVPVHCPESKVVIPSGYSEITRPGYKFLGWYYEPEGAVEYTRVQTGDTIEDPYLTIYAHWEPVVEDTVAKELVPPESASPVVDSSHRDFFAYTYCHAIFDANDNIIGFAGSMEDGSVYVYVRGSKNGHVPYPSLGEIDSGYFEADGDFVDGLPAELYSKIGYLKSDYLDHGNFTSLSWDEGYIETKGGSFCPNLRSISFPDSMEYIGQYIYCTSLESVKLPPKITSAGGAGYYSFDDYNEYDNYRQETRHTTFYGCTSLKTLDYSACPLITYFNGRLVGLDGCPALENLYLPPNVTMVEDCRDLANLKSIEIPGTCSEIRYAFYGSGMETATLHEGLVSCESAFRDCDNLKSVEVPSTVTDSDWMFYDCDSLKEVVLKDGLTWIGERAFGSCEKLESVVFPESTVHIQRRAFEGCESLTEITLHAENINEYAFRNCANLKTVNIYVDDILTIHESAFENTPNLETVNIIGGSGITIMSDAFNSSGLKNLNIDADGEVILYDNALGGYGWGMSGCPQLETVNINAEFTSLGSCCFAECTALEDVNISGAVALGNTGVFQQTAIREVKFEVAGSALGGSLFKDCFYLERVELSGSICDIFSYAFDNCINLEEVILPPDAYNSAGSPKIASCAFRNCESLKTVIVSEGITQIGTSAFSGCTNLEEIELSWRTTSIGRSAFSDCLMLKTLDLPWSLTTIGSNAFNGCTGLEEVKIYDNVTSVGSSAFRNCASLKKVHFVGSQFDTNGITMEYGFSSVFYGCTALEQIICDTEGNLIDRMAEEAGITACPEWMPLHELTIVTDAAIGDIKKKAHEGQLIYPDRYLTNGYSGVAYYADPGCTQAISYPYVMPAEDTTIYVSCGRNWWPVEPGTEGSTVSGSALTDCTVSGTYYVINGVTTLKKNCIGPTVTSVFIPAHVTTIEDGAFARATSLGEIIVQDTNAKFYSRGGMLFSSDGTLLACPQAAKTLNIPADTTAVKKGAFADLGLTAVYGPTTGPVAEAAISAGISYNEYLIMYYSNRNFVGIMTNSAGALLPATTKPTRSGYTFVGWSLTEGGQPVDMAEYTMPANDLILHAVWSRVEDHIFWMEIPKMMSVVSEEMFQASAAEAIRCHDGIETIEKRAFADCAKLKIVEIHNAKAEIAADAFDGCDLSKITIYAPEGSTAQTFAQSKGIAWKKLG